MDHVAQPLEPPNAKLVGGVWLPEGERHFVEMMLHNKKRRHVEDGKHTYQWHKIQAVLRALPADRRRVCLDIGAHVGLWAMWLVREFAHVHSFEPVAAHADIYPFNMPSDNYTLHRPRRLAERAAMQRVVVARHVEGIDVGVRGNRLEGMHELELPDEPHGP